MIQKPRQVGFRVKITLGTFLPNPKALLLYRPIRLTIELVLWATQWYVR